MTDLISRQQAIDEVMALPNCENGYSNTYDKARFISLLEELPSGEKTGAWWKTADGECMCTVCDSHWDISENETERFIYCPNCGARMNNSSD